MGIEEKLDPKPKVEFKPVDFIPGVGAFTNALQYKGVGWKSTTSNNLKVVAFMAYHATALYGLEQAFNTFFN